MCSRNKNLSVRNTFIRYLQCLTPMPCSFGGRYRNFPPDVDDYPPVQGKPSHSHYNDIFVLDTGELSVLGTRFATKR